MRWQGYLIFGLLSLVVSVLSVVLWMINPFTDLLLLLAAPPLRLLGYHPLLRSPDVTCSVQAVRSLSASP